MTAGVSATAVTPDAAARAVAALRGIQAALAELHGVESFGQMVQLATAALCRHCDFTRAILFGVEGGAMVAESVHFPNDPGWAEEIRGFAQGPGRPLLAETDLEREMARRREPALVRDAQNDPRTTRALVSATRTEAYVAAPIMPTGKVIGFLHADRYGGRPVDELDRDALFAYTEGLGFALQRTLLHEQVAHHRRRAEQLAGQVADLALDLGSAHVGFTPPVPRPADAAARAALDAVPGAALTRREMEVLELLSTGATNAEIATRLFVSHSTAKAHVKHILRKLGVGNRAEAAARYTRMTHQVRRSSVSDGP